jgi:hypothetical protein
VTVPPLTSVTITTPRTKSTTTTVRLSTADAARLQASLSDPSKITSIRDARTRAKLTAELADLDRFLAVRPEVRPYRLHIWYVAHHANPPDYARRVAALIWCGIWFPRDCG